MQICVSKNQRKAIDVHCKQLPPERPMVQSLPWNLQTDSNIWAFSTQAVYYMMFWVISPFPRLTGLPHGYFIILTQNNKVNLCSHLFWFKSDGFQPRGGAWHFKIHYFTHFFSGTISPILGRRDWGSHMMPCPQWHIKRKARIWSQFSVFVYWTCCGLSFL